MSCQSQYDSLVSSSVRSEPSAINKCLWTLRNVPSHILWHLETKGLLKTSKFVLAKALKRIGVKKKDNPSRERGETQSSYDEVLNLQLGELVEVKSEEEILATLDENRKNKGLLWMAGMRRFCGKRFRVYKRLERILLESTEEYRELKNTVLLEGVMCDGKEFYGCDRSCFHYWREAWLSRVNE